MSQEIKVVLTGDESQLAAALNKAAANVDAFDKKIKRGRDAGLPMLQLTPKMLGTMESASLKTAELARQTRLAGGSARMGSMGFLAFSQAVEDAQYGVKGILNNIPQMVLGFGGGMGLAGAISLAAVAAVSIYPHLQRITGALQNENLKKASEEFGAIFDQAMKAANAIQLEADNARDLADLADRLKSSYAERLQFMGQMGDYYDKALSAAKAERDFSLQTLSARQAMADTLGGDTRPFIATRQKIESAGVSADLANREAAMKATQAASSSAEAARSNIAAENAARELADTNALVAAKKDLASAERTLAMAKAAVDNSTGREQAANAATAADAQKRIDLLKDQVKALEDVSRVNKETGADALKQAADTATAAHAKLNGINSEITGLKRLQTQLQEIHKLERQRWAVDAVKEQLATTKAAHPELKQALETAKTQQQSATGITDELMVLRKTAEQGKKAGDQLRENIALRKEAAQLAKDAGLTDEQAENLLKERAKLEKDIAKIPSGSIRDRRRQRSDEREQERIDKRNERVAEAQRKRDARDQAGRPIDLAKGRENIDRILERAEANRQKAQEELLKNTKEQTELQKKIEKALAAITAA